jgi:CheY-like chemotaxis protein/DNA-directed RNA polymerase specialized sigma24 family protein
MNAAKEPFMAAGKSYASLFPYLRRYARALTGSQPAGDAAVAKAIAYLATPQAETGETLARKVALYRAFHRANPRAEHVAGEEGGVDGRLGHLAPLSRQAYLLTAMEGLSTKAAAQVLDVSDERAAALLAEAERAIDADLKTSVLIIEDEAVIAADIEQTVRELGHEVSGICPTAAQAVRAANERPPGLVLADIQLAGQGSGLDAANAIQQSVHAPVIFVTAFPERLLTGARPEPIYLVMKPFVPSTLKAMIAQALFFHPATAGVR